MAESRQLHMMARRHLNAGVFGGWWRASRGPSPLSAYTLEHCAGDRRRRPKAATHLDAVFLTEPVSGLRPRS